MLRDTSIRTVVMLLLLLMVLSFNGALLYFSLLFSPVSLAFNALSALILLITWVYLTTYLVNPINNVKEAIDEITEGEFSLKIPVFGKNCAGRLITGVNNMSSMLYDLVKSILFVSDEVISSSDFFNKKNKELVKAAHFQSEKIREVVANIEEIHEGTNKNLQSTKTLKNLTSQSEICAGVGKGLMVDLIESINQVRASAASMNEITSIIDGIAFQTNLLSLNAAVEAARAGENGRGFAIVAAEVRNLSKKSSEAAKNIKSLIESTGVSINHGVAVASEAQKNMSEIVSNSSMINSVMEDIFMLTDQQNSEIEQTNKAIKSMSDQANLTLRLYDELSVSSELLLRSASSLKEKSSYVKI